MPLFSFMKWVPNHIAAAMIAKLCSWYSLLLHEASFSEVSVPLLTQLVLCKLDCNSIIYSSKDDEQSESKSIFGILQA